MDATNRHLVSDIANVKDADRERYEPLDDEQIELAKKLLDGRSEKKLTRQQVRRLQRLAKKSGK